MKSAHMLCGVHTMTARELVLCVCRAITLRDVVVKPIAYAATNTQLNIRVCARQLYRSIHICARLSAYASYIICFVYEEPRYTCIDMRPSERT